MKQMNRDAKMFAAGDKTESFTLLARAVGVAVSRRFVMPFSHRRAARIKNLFSKNG